MRRAARSLLLLALVAILASPLSAADDKKKKKKKKERGFAVAALRLPKTIQLSDDQKAKVEALQKEYGPQLGAIGKKLAGIITPEQRKARAEAFKKAREDGKKGKELREAVNAALNISAEQKKQLADVQKEQRALNAKAREALLSILTEEQKAQLKKGGKKKPKKKAAKAADAE